MKENDFKQFLGYLIKAIKNMDGHYFQLPIAGNEEPIYRERVYCYELYHQLRCILVDRLPYKLNGEVDKAGHSIIRTAKKPDFIVHLPGDMEYNLVVIEVKPVTVNDRIDDLIKDFKTLKWFLGEAKYYRAIMLIYGMKNNDLPEKIKDEIEKIDDKRIIIIWHSEANKKPEIIWGDATSPNTT